MKIGRTAALLAAASGTVMLGAGVADAHSFGGGDDGGSGTQINNCFVILEAGVSSSTSSFPEVNCLNFEGTFGKFKGDGSQLNNCYVVSHVGNVLFITPEENEGPSVNCFNIRADQSATPKKPPKKSQTKAHAKSVTKAHTKSATKAHTKSGTKAQTKSHATRSHH
ncbi:hypothetical protein [Streptomyces sp. NPDC058092]|uniref:hypothetical protein n=1 Tax=Streptomyces sp. NPDC058092 TaxID=3346336 RepID=UPI0036E03844